MNISETKENLIDAHVQLSSYYKSMNSLGVQENDFSFEFDWIETCIGLCEIYNTVEDEFIKTRALNKLKMILDDDLCEESTQLSFDFTQKCASTKSSSIISGNNIDFNPDIPALKFEDTDF